MALTPSTCSEPKSYSVLFTRPTHSFSRTPVVGTSRALRRPCPPSSGVREQRDLVGRLDATGLEEDLLTIDQRHSLLRERGEDGHFDDVNADRFVLETELRQNFLDLFGHGAGALGPGGMAPRNVEMPARAPSYGISCRRVRFEPPVNHGL